jgi:Sec20.
MNTNLHNGSNVTLRRRIPKHESSHNKNLKILLHEENSRQRKKEEKGGMTAAQEARDITASLRRTKAMMQQELHRVSHVSETISQDGIKLKMTEEEHLNMKGGIRGAKGSLSKLKLKEKEEAIIFWASVVFFYMVVLYVLWTRIRIPFFLW